MHLLERPLDITETDPFGHELVQRQPTLLVQIDQHRKIPLRQTIAVPRRLQRPTPGKEIDQRHLHRHLRRRHPDEDDRPSEIAGIERLLPGFRATDGIDDHIRPEPTRQLLDGLDGIDLRGIDRVGGTQIESPVEFFLVTVDSDDRRRPRQASPGDRSITDTAAPDHGDGIPAGNVPGVHRRTQPGHHPTPEQTHHRRIGLRVDLGALAFVDESLVGERPDPQRRRQFGAVGESHLLRRIVGVEAIPGGALLAGSAFPAHRTPVQHHDITDLDMSDSIADRFDGARGFVAEQERELVVDAALAVMQIGMTHPARGDGDHDIVRAGIGNGDRLDRDGLTLRLGDDGMNGL